MATTLTIRLDDEAREPLENEARSRGQGVSSFVRELVEAEARRVRRRRVRADGDAVVDHLATRPEARAELEVLGTPVGDGR